ncbi:hypothetical protein FDZ73_15035 [bacterium]|nr:MAG: hypothetical protein FDZ73_15035 [bacterium]
MTPKSGSLLHADSQQEIIHGTTRSKAGQNKHSFVYKGLIQCGYCGCAMVGEIKKGKYIYYHCTGNRGECPGKKSVREEELEKRFKISLAALQIDDDVVAWIIKALRESHEDQKKYRDESIACLSQQRDKLQKRLDALYVDKLDGVVSAESYQRLSSEWNAELSSIGYKIDQHQRASKDYLDNGIKLLELAQHAVIIHKNSSAEEKRRILKIVHSNSFWRDGELTANYQKPFDLLAVTNKSYKRKKATFPEKSDLRDNWLPSADSNHGQGG